MQRAGDARPQGSTACPRAERISPSNGFHTPAYVARASFVRLCAKPSRVDLALGVTRGSITSNFA